MTTTPAISGQSVVLYHANCADGFLSAYLCYLYHKRINKPCEFIAVQYNQDPPEGLEGKDVMIVDFSYSPVHLGEIARKANRVVMLDHHQTAADRFGGYGQKVLNYNSETGIKRVLGWLIEDMSGCGITLAYLDSSLQAQFRNTSNFARNDRIQFLTSRIQDRDLWKFEFGEESKAVHQMLTSQPYSFELLDKMVFEETQTEFNLRLEKAKAVLQYKKELVNKWSKKKDYILFQGYTVPAVNCPSDYSSDIGDALSEGNSFVLLYQVSQTKVFCSLRSSKEKGVDVKVIAERFGGGGHIPAAGFSIETEKLPDLLAGRL